MKGEAYREEYERDFLVFLEGLVADLERRFKRGKERLQVRPNDPSVTNVHSTNDETEEKRILLDLQVKELLAKIEACGEEGRIREAQELTEQAEVLKAELDQLQGSVDYENPLHKLEKKMEVCTVCGAFLVMNDAPKRIGAHFEGRQHSGWVKVREAVELMRQKWSSYQRKSSHSNVNSSSSDSRRNTTSSSYSRSNSSYRGDRERERDRDHDRERERDRDRYHDSRDSRDKSNNRDSRDIRDSRDSSSYRDSRDDYKYSSSKSLSSSDHSSSRKHSRRDSVDSQESSRDSKRPTFENYVPGTGLDYELGEIIEEGEIPDTKRK